MKRLTTTLALCIALSWSAGIAQAQGEKSSRAPSASQPTPAPSRNGLPETTMEKLENERERTSIFEDPLQGVIVNRTVTVLGNDFYQFFSNYWNEANHDSRYSIAIFERPTARWGSEIWIQFRQERVFHTFLSPARQAAKGVAEAAAAIVEQNITRAEIYRMTFKDYDLAPEEL